MPHDHCLTSLDIERIRTACIHKALAEPEQAGVHHSPKSGRIPLADWRSWVFCNAADRSSAVLSFDADPLIVDVQLGSAAIPFPVDFRVETSRGFHFVAFDMPGMELWQHGLLLSLAARGMPHRLVRVTDQDFDAFLDSGRMPAPLNRKGSSGAPPGHSSPSLRP